MKSILVQEVYQSHGTLSTSIPQDESLEKVIERFVQDGNLRGIFLVDSKGRFQGVITRADLLKWARLRLPTGSRHSRIGVRDILRSVFADKARDLAIGDWKTLGVRPTDNLEKAFNQMLEYEVIAIPVLDKDGKIIGDLTLSKLLQRALDAGKKLQDERRT